MGGILPQPKETTMREIITVGGQFTVVEFFPTDTNICQQVDADRESIWFGKYSDSNQRDRFDGTALCTTIALLYEEVVVGACRVLIEEEMSLLPMGAKLGYVEPKLGYVTEVSRLYLVASRVPPKVLAGLTRFAPLDYLVLGIEGLMQYQPLAYTYASIRKCLLMGIEAIGVRYEEIGSPCEHAGREFIPVRLYRRSHQPGRFIYRQEEELSHSNGTRYEQS